MKVPLYRIAHARSGDKGDGSNVGIIAYDLASYELMRRALTPARVKKHFKGIVRGKVERFEAPNILALNFLLHDSLGGGGSTSLKNDAQGKTHGMALLRMEIEVPRGFRLPEVGKSGAMAPGSPPIRPARRKSAGRKTASKKAAKIKRKKGAKTTRRKAASKKAARKKSVGKKVTRKRPAPRKAPGKKSPPRKAPGKKSPSRKAPGKKSPPRKAPGKKAPARRAPGKKR